MDIREKFVKEVAKVATRITCAVYGVIFVAVFVIAMLSRGYII